MRIFRIVPSCGLAAVVSAARVAAMAIALNVAVSAAASAAPAELVVVVVSTQSPVKALTKDQIAGIFLAKTSRFPGGEVAMPIDQAEGSAAREEFYTKFTGKSPAQVRAHWSMIIFTGRGQPPAEVANGAETKKILATNPLAIGYIDQSEVDSSVRVLSQ